MSELPEEKDEAGLSTVWALTMDMAPAAVTSLAAQWPPPAQPGREGWSPNTALFRSPGDSPCLRGPTVCTRRPRLRKQGLA